MTYVGIDPGLSGAVAAIRPDGSVEITDAPVEKVERGGGSRRWFVPSAMAEILRKFAPAAVAIELVNAMPPRQSAPTDDGPKAVIRDTLNRYRERAERVRMAADALARDETDPDRVEAAMLRSVGAITAIEDFDKAIVALEDLPDPERRTMGATSAFSFGEGFGLWQGVVAALGLPLVRVAPPRWKKLMLADTDRSKGAAIIRATELFPGAAPRLEGKRGNGSAEQRAGRAEALLIAEWRRRQG